MTSAKNDPHRNLDFCTKHKFDNFVYLLKNWLIFSHGIEYFEQPPHPLLFGDTYSE